MYKLFVTFHSLQVTRYFFVVYKWRIDLVQEFWFNTRYTFFSVPSRIPKPKYPTILIDVFVLCF